LTRVVDRAIGEEGDPSGMKVSREKGPVGVLAVVVTYTPPKEDSVVCEVRK
jgi:hypothetical protein